MTQKELNDLDHLERAATPGEWHWNDCGGYHEVRSQHEHGSTRVFDDGSSYGEYSESILPNSPDGRLVLAARNALPRLIARIRELEGALAEFNNAWETATGGFDGLSTQSSNNLEAASELAAAVLAKGV